MYLSYQQVAATNVVKTVAALTVPGKATHAELQADTGGVNYTMDDTNNPTVSAGMVLLATEGPKLFTIDDVRRIRFIRQGGSNTNLNIHYLAGRDI